MTTPPRDHRRREPDLVGLVLAGGRSSRMKADKAALAYAGRPQTERAFRILSRHCENVFLSNRKDQADAPGHTGLPQLHDMFPDLGPMGGILTALTACPGCAWLVLACDLPHLGDDTLANLLRRRNPAKLATAYRSAHDGLPEPLCAVYEADIRPELERLVARGVVCPRKALTMLDIELLAPVDPSALDNVNTPDEYDEARRRIEKQGS